MTATTTSPVLGRHRDRLNSALCDALDRLDPASRAQALYHLGLREPDGRPGPGAGKAVRPALALLSAEAAGGAAEEGLPGAVAVELVHDFSLLHDDLMDGDTERRHRPTVWARWGPAAAILTGDALLALASEVLLEAPSPHACAATRLVSATVRELVRGQVEDVAFEGRRGVTVPECLAMAAGKTGALLATSAQIGAVLVGAPASVRAALRAFGAELGIAFQLVDDLLGIWGDPTVTGKPVLSDLRTRKKSLPVAYALSAGGPAARELARRLADRTDPVDDEPRLRHLAALVEAAGGRERAAAEARRCAARAEEALAGAGLPDGPRAELVALAHHVVERDR
jgi:geranylgeranyl diphosphate synthase, type I